MCEGSADAGVFPLWWNTALLRHKSKGEVPETAEMHQAHNLEPRMVPQWILNTIASR